MSENKQSGTRYKFGELILYLILYKLTIEFIYIFSISKTYSYYGLTLEMNYIKLLISIFFLIVIVLISPKDKKRPSTFIFLGLEIFLFIPLISYFWLNNMDISYVFYVLTCLILISLILKINILPIKIKEEVSSSLLKIFFILYILISIFLIIERGGIDSRSLDFDTVYELREENNIVGVLGYLMNWSTKVFFPIFFLYYFFQRKYLIWVPIAFLQLFMYLSYGNKAFLFSIGLVILTTIFVKKNIYLRGITFLLIALNILSYMLFKFNITDLLHRTVPYRMIFIPSQIQYQYFEFFSVRDKMLYAEGVIGKLTGIENPYEIPIPILISKVFLGNESYSNTGMFSDAYYNGGILAMLIVSIIFSLLLLIIDISTKNIPIYIVVGSLSFMVLSLVDTGFQTTFLTGGLGLMVILLILLNTDNKLKNFYENGRTL